MKSLINRYRIVGALFTVAILSACLSPLTAYADPSNGTLGIIANYSDEISAQHGDTFTIDYVNEDTGDDGSLTVDSSEISSSFMDIEMAPGSYTIIDISYSGANNDIVDSGYGIENSFRIKEGGDDIVHICIGASETKSLESDYNSALIKDAEHDAYGNRDVFYDENGAYRYETDETGNNVQVYIDSEQENSEEDEYYDNFEDTEGEIPIQQPNGQEPITEYYETEEEEDTSDGVSSLTFMICVVCILGAAGGGVIFYLHKKGKI